jgi:uncharacterized membrane protein
MSSLPLNLTLDGQKEGERESAVFISTSRQAVVVSLAFLLIVLLHGMGRLFR